MHYAVLSPKEHSGSRVGYRPRRRGRNRWRASVALDRQSWSLIMCFTRAGFIFISTRCFRWARPIHGQAAPGIADEATRCCMHISPMPFIVEDSRNVTCWSLYIMLSNAMHESLVKSCLRDITSCLHDPYMILAIA